MHDNPTEDSMRPSVSTVTRDDDSHSTIRENLSARLEREKLRAQCARAHELANVSGPTEETSLKTRFIRKKMLSTGPEQPQGDYLVDPHVIEKKLRKRAHLQARLEAEKRSTGL